jgi:general secretion pathway protein K
MRQQQGVALVTVLLIVVLASTIIVAMASRQQLDIRRTENTLRQSQAMMYLLGIEEWIKHLISEDRRNNETDHLGENWATRVPSLPVEGGSIEGYIEDLQGRFNLNNLHQSGEAGRKANTRLRRLLESLNIDEDVANAIQDWIDRDQETRFPGGAEDGDYLGLTPAYRTADRMMQSPSELLLIKGITREDYEKLLPHVCTLPRVTTININTATAEVLTTIANNLSVIDMQGIVSQREDQPFDSVDELLSDKLFAGQELTKDHLSVSSDFFLLRSKAEISHIEAQMNVIYERDADGRVYTIMRAQGDL